MMTRMREKENSLKITRFLSTLSYHLPLEHKLCCRHIPARYNDIDLDQLTDLSSLALH